MIVRVHDDRLELITQPDHARLAGDVLAAWRADGVDRRPTRDALLFATREHDRGWARVDAAPTVNPSTGRPFDFVAEPDPVKHELWPRAVATLGAESPYAAALVAEHALTVYDQHRGAAEWADFFATLTEERDRWLRESGQPRRQFDADYPLLRLADLISLAFCNGWTEPVSSAGRRLILTRTAVAVSPDPFDGAGVPLCVARRTLPNRRYTSDADLRAEFDRAPVSTLEGRAAGATHA